MRSWDASEAQAHVLGVYRHGAEEGKHLQKRLKRSWRRGMHSLRWACDRSAVSSKNLLEEIEEEASEQVARHHRFMALGDPPRCSG